MTSSHLVGKCGLYCGACTVYVAQRDSETWRKKIADNSNCTPEQVRCNGCGDLTSDCWGNGCKIVLCTRAKGVSYCYECPEYHQESCEKFSGLCKSYLQAGVDLRKNLSRIQTGETEEWLRESAARFTCQACGKPVSAWFSECHHCGSALR